MQDMLQMRMDKIDKNKEDTDRRFEESYKIIDTKFEELKEQNK